jgi:transposase
MARAFSNDLRCRFLDAYERKEGSLQALSQRFGVSWDYGKKIRKQQLRSGRKERIEPSRHGPVSRVTAKVQEQLRAAVSQQPDSTLGELQQQIEERAGIRLSLSWVGEWLRRLGLRRKKNRSTPESATRKSTASGANSSWQRSTRWLRRS